jgi:ubiquitin thioesterase OTU1
VTGLPYKAAYINQKRERQSLEGKSSKEVSNKSASSTGNSTIKLKVLLPATTLTPQSLPMRFRIRGPSGTHTISFDDDATVGDLCAKITELTSLILWDLKSGFPPQPLDISGFPASTKLTDTPYKFNGEQIIVAPGGLPGVHFAAPTASHSASMSNAPLSSTQPKTQATSSPSKKPQATSSTSKKSTPSLARKPNSVEHDPPEVRIPTRGGKLVLRVMPDDNSCLFRSLSTCLLGNDLDGMTELRSIVAAAVQSDPETYNEVVLQKAPDEYCRWIQDESSWGGYVDIKAISEYFQIEVCSIDVQNDIMQRYSEGAALRCIIVYSGIHYDALAFVPDGAGGDADFDQKQFEASDDAILEAAREIGRILMQRKYFTDTAKFAIQCGQCGWKGKGENDAQKHAMETNHTDFQEAG